MKLVRVFCVYVQLLDFFSLSFTEREKMDDFILKMDGVLYAEEMSLVEYQISMFVKFGENFLLFLRFVYKKKIWMKFCKTIENWNLEKNLIFLFLRIRKSIKFLLCKTGRGIVKMSLQKNDWKMFLIVLYQEILPI